MKVLLKNDVRGSGKAGDIITVSDGYARNFLIPKGLAVQADATVINSAGIKKEAAVHRQKQQREKAKELANDMSGLTVKVYAKCGENGRLFGSVTTQEVSDALKKQYDIAVDKKKIYFDEPIKNTGIVNVTAHMFEDTQARFKVEVLPKN